MNGVTYEYTDEEAPDGEYLVLSFPEEGTRFDFFLMEGKENCIREVHEGSDYETMFLATFDDAETRATDVVKEWYYAAVGATPAGIVENADEAAEPILGILGGWKATDSPRMSDEATAAFEKAMEGFTGVGYEPLACLATQQVSGTNYAVFCKAQVVYPDAKPYYAVVYVYEDLQGNAELLKIVSLTPNGEADPNAGAGGTLLGGWTVAEEQEPGLEAFDQAAQKLLGVSYTPIYVLSSQVVSGTNYCVLSKAEVVAPGAEGYYTLATVYQDLSGNVEISGNTKGSAANNVYLYNRSAEMNIQITGELKVKKVTFDPEKIDLDDIHELERWTENAFRDGFAKAQEIATEKMKPLMGGLGNLGF